MFYSHEVLTSRKYGVATVWLVATLGAKSSSKKINRKAILNVDVPKACQTIIDPVAPMALRLQGNLLYGVSRVYLQQCGYVLSDAQNTQNAMRMMLRAVKDAELDPDAGKARPEHLILQDDPSFLPDFALPPPELLADLDLALPLETPRSGESQSLTPFGSQEAPGTPKGPTGGLVLPSSSTHDMEGFIIDGDDGSGSVGGPSGIQQGEDMAEPLAAADFGFDEDGNFLDFTAGDVISSPPAAPGGATMPNDAGASVRVRQDHEDGQRAGAELFGDQMDLDLPMFGDDLPEGEAFPTAAQSQAGEHSEVVESSSTVAAPMRRKKRTARILTPDATMELRNTDLANWNLNYLENMREASRIKSQHRVAIQAKQNAEYWVWGAGIGGIGHRLLGSTGPTPFDKFYGDSLFELFTGVNRKNITGAKRDRDSGIDEVTQGESRRVRHKSDDDEEHMGRRDEDEAMFLPGGDEVELPREAPSALEDQQAFSAMPWNISASIRGSSAVPRTGRTGVVGSVGGPSSLTGPQGSLHHRHGSRMVSASPLHGRGQPGGLEALRSLEGEDEFGNLGSDDFGMPPGPSSDGFYPDPAPFPQTSVHVREALSAEGENFLTFVFDAIIEKRNRGQAELEHMSDVMQAEAAGDIDDVLFEEILPPARNSKMVAAQGLLMILVLGTRGMLDVRQDGGFEEISLSVTEKARVMQMADVIQEDEEQDEVVGGQFDDQFAAGGTDAEGEEDDDQDSLYGP